MGKDSAARIELGRSFHQMGTFNEIADVEDYNAIRARSSTEELSHSELYK